jgi:mono/diheme cytochrome c family protein
MKPGRLLCLTALAVTPFVTGCGSRGVSVAEGDQNRAGAELFAANCAGCHTLDVAGTQGSATKIRGRERVDGPNFNTRKEEVDQVLYAIRNGGFSGAIMPENILVGDDAQKVAEFLAKYSGQQKKQANASGESDTGESGGAGAP